MDEKNISTSKDLQQVSPDSFDKILSSPKIVSVEVSSAHVVSGAASAKVQLRKNGKVLVLCALVDLKTETSIIIAQIAADILGLSVEKIAVRITDPKLTEAYGTGVYETDSTMGFAVHAASSSVLNKAIALATDDHASALYNQNPDHIIAVNGKLFIRNKAGKGDSFSEIMNRNELHEIASETAPDV